MWTNNVIYTIFLGALLIPTAISLASICKLIGLIRRHHIVRNIEDVHRKRVICNETEKREEQTNEEEQESEIKCRERQMR